MKSIFSPQYLFKECKKFPVKIKKQKSSTIISPCQNCIELGKAVPQPQVQTEIKYQAVNDMGKAQIGRNERRCVLCRYWNGAIGSTTIQVLVGGNVFTYENTEKHFCFKKRYWN